ncbi:MAG: response regulator, partial [Bacteroidetes bacterium]|nr:response regulator [Bacteroidota bacterium]
MIKNKRFSFEIRIVAGILLAVLIVAATGILSYHSLRDIVKGISEDSRPDLKLVLLKDILSDLSDAESSVKSYSISNDNQYLPSFYLAPASIEKKIDRLYGLSSNENQTLVIDSISVLVEDKFSILQNLVWVKSGDRLEESLNKVTKKIKETDKQVRKKAKEENIEEAENEAVTGYKPLRKIFSRKDKQEIQEEDVSEEKAINTEQIEFPIKEIEKEIEKIKVSEAKQTQVSRALELELTLKDKIVMDKIRALVFGMEVEENELFKVKSANAEIKARNAYVLIGSFCILVSILLLIVGYFIVSFFIKNNAYEKALEKAKTEAENLADAKAGFLANMSHEIRTPLNAIAGFTEQLLGSALKKEQQEQLEIVRKSTNHLMVIINDILDFSKLGSGKMELEQVGFSVDGIFNDVVSIMNLEANKKQLKLNYQNESKLPEVLIGDPVRLKQIMLNIVNNAIKFTENGSVKIHASSSLMGDKEFLLKISVSDTGIGIPIGKLDTVFNEFEQAENSTTRKYGGTGLGLAITKKLVENQNGRIYIQSEESVGTTITIELLYLLGFSDMLVTEEKLMANPALLKGKKILIVDDAPYNLKLLESIFAKHNIDCYQAGNGQEALRMVKSNNYDLILMDMLMPVMNGLDATKAIRKLGAEKANIPIIALTAAATMEDEAQFKKSGINDFLLKPFKEQELFIKMLKNLNLGSGCFPSQDTEPESSNVGLRKAKETGEKQIDIKFEKKAGQQQVENPYFDLRELRTQANGDIQFVNEMLSLFIKNTSEGINIIKAGIEDNSMETIRQEAHKIISPCKHIESKSLVSIC